MKIHQAFVLAGGKGERLRPLTNETPKPMVRVAGKPILEYCIELLAANGVTDIVLGTGYMHEKIESYFADGRKFGIEVTYSVEKGPLGTGGALKQAEAMLGERFFMLNGDNIADFSLTAMSQRHFDAGALATIALVEVENAESYGAAKVEGMKITEFVEKPGPESAPSRLVNAGAYVIEKAALSALPPGFSLIEKAMFPELASRGKLAAYMHKGMWLTTDTPERIARAEAALSGKR